MSILSWSPFSKKNGFTYAFEGMLCPIGTSLNISLAFIVFKLDTMFSTPPTSTGSPLEELYPITCVLRKSSSAVLSRPSFVNASSVIL